MTIAIRRPIGSITLTELDPCGVPLDRPSHPATPDQLSHLPGVTHAAVLAQVESVEGPWRETAIVWGRAAGESLVFTVDAVTGLEMRAALEAGEEPTAIVEPDQRIGAGAQSRP